MNTGHMTSYSSSFFLIKKERTFHGEVVDSERDTSSDTEDGESFSGQDEEHNARTSCGAPLRILRARLSCKRSRTKRRCVKWL